MSQETGSNAPKDSVTLIDHSTGRELNLPLMEGTVGPKVIDIRKLYSELDYFTFDPGFMATGSCDSKITYIDGDQGILLHRGYPIDQLAKKECYLLHSNLEAREQPRIVTTFLATF